MKPLTLNTLLKLTIIESAKTNTMQQSKKIESDGGYVVGEEPIELIFVKIVGRRFTVEYKEV